MYDDLINISYILIIFLVPIIPAYFIYKVLPQTSDAEVIGPFAGLKIKLTGALAGYFIITLLAIGVTKQLRFSDQQKQIDELKQQIASMEQKEHWPIEGKIVLGADPQPVMDPSKIRLTVKPPAPRIDDDGRFLVNWDVKTPMLRIERDGYLPEVVQLEAQPRYGATDYEVKFDQNSKKIIINKSITLKPTSQLSPYAATGETLGLTPP
jgi:hypothetical protein